MGFRPPANEFNALAVMPQELQLRLMNLAFQGETVASVFTAMADRAGVTERGRAVREREIARQDAMVQAVMASQERVAEFQKRLDQMERASYEALIENEEKLRAARKELERVRERAFEVALPDGKVVKVYRDGNVVRDDDGNVVSEEVIKAEDMPEGFSTWDERQEKEVLVQEAQREHRESAAYHERVQSAQETVRAGGLTEDDTAELEAGLADMPQSVRERMPDTGATSDRAESDIRRPGQGASALVPM